MLRNSLAAGLHLGVAGGAYITPMMGTGWLVADFTTHPYLGRWLRFLALWPSAQKDAQAHVYLKSLKYALELAVLAT